MPKTVRKLIYDKGRKCYYDLDTSNKSFVQLAKDYHTLGIKDCYFHLTLYDKSIAGINPYDPELSEDTINRIIIEIARNPWYFLREVSRIKEEGGNEKGIPYRANRGNIAQAWCVIHGIDSWLCLPRQQGKTVSFLCLTTWMYVIGTTNSKFIFINKESSNAKSNLSIVSNMIDLLPVWLRGKYVRDNEGRIQKGKDNATELLNSLTGNNIITRGKAINVETATSIGRGLTAPILHFDEPEFTPYIATIVGNSVSTYDTAAANAKKNGGMYARVFTCTPGDLDSQPGQDAEIILSHTLQWSDSFYDKGVDFIKEQGSHVNKWNSIVYIEFAYNQIGKDEKWLEEMTNKIGDELIARRELLLQRMHGSSLSPFPQEDLNVISELMCNPIDELWVDTWRFFVYERLDNTIPYIVSVDCATGTLGDNNAITIINPFTEKPVAEFLCNYIGEPSMVDLITDLVLHFVPLACVVIERNSVGSAIIAYLLRGPIANNIYFDANKELVEEDFRAVETVQSMLKREAATKRYFGVSTTVRTREEMFAVLADRVQNHKDKFVTKNITTDLASLVRTKTGKIEAGPGRHDDSIMSYLIGMYVLIHGNNLMKFGINQHVKYEEETVKLTSKTVNQEINSQAIEDARIMEEREKNSKLNNYEAMIRAAAMGSAKFNKMREERGLIMPSDGEEAKEYERHKNPLPTYGLNADFFDEINDVGGGGFDDFDGDIFDY